MGRRMAEQMAPDVWWLHGSRGSNVFAIEGEAGLVLIDTGFASSLRGIVEDIDLLRRGGRVSHVLLTHAHVDHAGAAAAIRARYGAVIAAGAGDCALNTADEAVLREPIGRSHRRRRFVRWLLGRSSAVPVEVRIDEILVGERMIAGLLAIPVPGHTPGSYCYVLEDRGVAFVGDLVISHDHGLSRPMMMANADDRLYLDSLRAFASRAPDIGCPGHGRPIDSDFRNQLSRLSALSRRSFWSPRGAIERARRMRDFGRGITRVRRAPPSRDDGPVGHHDEAAGG